MADKLPTHGFDLCPLMHQPSLIRDLHSCSCCACEVVLHAASTHWLAHTDRARSAIPYYACTYHARTTAASRLTGLELRPRRIDAISLSFGSPRSQQESGATL